MMILKKLLNVSSLAIVTLSLMITFGCSVNDTPEPVNIQQEPGAIPSTGSTFYLQNKRSGLHLDVENKSNSNGANVQQWGNASGTHRQWEIISTSGNYVRLKGVDSGKSLTVQNGSNSNGANVEIRAWNNLTHQEWQIIDVGNGYYRLKCRDSGKSLYVENAGTSNGDNVEQRAYNSSDDSFKWFFTPLSGTGGGGGGATSAPSSVLGISDQTWKINSFDGSPGSNATYYDDITDLSGVTVANYEDPNYYYTDGTWTYFKCYRGLGGSANSGNPRVELRELSNGNLASWNGSSGTHAMTWTVRVDRLPEDADGNGGVLCFGQIHGPSENNNGVEVDDVIRVQFIGDENQTTGGVRLKISGYITEEVQGGSLIIDNGYQLDTEYTFKLQYSGGTVKLFQNGSQVFTEDMDTGTEENYFKVGNYLQSVQGASYNGSYGLVAIKNLSVTHN